MEQVGIGETIGNRTVKKGLNASALKIIAVISMTLYSIGNSFIEGLYNQKLLPQGRVGTFIYLLFIVLGIPSFVLFTFLLTEGFERTSSRKHYLIRLCAAAVLSELPFDLFYSGTGNMLLQNIIVSYIVAFITMWIIDGILKKTVPSDSGKPGMNKVSMVILIILTIVLGLVVSELIRGLYGCMIVGLALIFYFLKNSKIAMFAGGILTFCAGYILSDSITYALSKISAIKLNHIVKYSFTFADYLNRLFGNYRTALTLAVGAVLGLILILFYNGKKGYHQEKIFYYIYFPIHMLMIIFGTFLFNLVIDGLK